MPDDAPTTEPRPPAITVPGAAGLTLRLWRFARRHGRFTVAFGVVVGLLVIVNLIREYGPAGAGLVLGPAGTVALVVLARRWGLSWSDLGLSRRNVLRGAGVAAAAVVVVTAVYAVAVAVPLTRAAFLDARYHLPTGKALVTALVVIPLGTVLMEEIAFRGVLQGLVTRHRGVGWGLGLSSVLFGAWHILPSLGLNSVNPAVTSVVGGGVGARILVVAGAVAVTAAAGLLLGELRRRSGSLLASGGLHWAVNGIAVLAAAALHTTGLS